MPSYSKNRTSSKLYRDIYKQHYEVIPIDENGRTYEIHHIDGDDSNNDPSNLIALSMKEHYDIHYSQGDYGACVLMAFKMNSTDEEISQLMKQSHRKRLDAGIHPTQQTWRCLHCGVIGKNLLNYSNHHGDRCLKNPNLSEIELNVEMQRKRIIQSKRSKSQTIAQKNSVKKGNHNTQTKWTCIHCQLSGRGIGNYNSFHGDNCLKNPNLSEEQKLKRKQLSKDNSERAKKSARRDETTYSFQHQETKEIQVMTREQFTNLYKCKSCQLTLIIKNPNRTLYGWKIISAD